MSSYVDFETFPPNVSSAIRDLLSGSENFLPPVPTGSTLSCKDWTQEAALRMLLNYTLMQVTVHLGRLPLYNFEYTDLINWESLKNNINSLLNLKNDETLLIHSDKPSIVFKTSPSAPRILFVNTFNEEFEDYKEASFRVYEQLHLQSWNYIGIQETLFDNKGIWSDIAQKNTFYGNLEGKLVVLSGFGHLGTAHALAVSMNGGTALVIDPNRKLIEDRLRDGFCTRMFEDIDSAFDVAIDAKRNGQAKIIALVGNAAEVLTDTVNKGVVPNFVTDLTHADDPLNGYIPTGYSFSDALRIRRTDPQHYKNLSTHSMMVHVKAMLELQNRGAIAFEFGNGLREKAYNRGLHNAFGVPSFIPEYVFPVLTETNRINMKWIALSGQSEDIFVIDDVISMDYQGNTELMKLNDLIYKVNFQNGLYARKCKLEPDTCISLAKTINSMVESGEITAPVLLEFSHFEYFDSENKKINFNMDSENESVTEMIQNYINNPNGASWVSIKHRGSEEGNYYLRSGHIIIADGTKEAEDRIDQLLVKVRL